MKKGWVRKLWGAPIETQIAALREHGVAERNIYVDGRGPEDLPALFRSLRPGHKVCIAADLRVFGSSRKEILLIVGQLEADGYRVCDVAHPEDKTMAQKLERALSELAKYARWKGSKATAKATGRQGGRAKRKAYEEKREGVARADVIQRLVDHPKLAWQDCADILGEPFSVATLRRRYPRSKPR